ncbi:hypothetical protein [Streptomyces sp. H27-H5]|uniref:hypothetical protein n=1 Tax=Streptomyces sp. H27-H5 TaxID=2996460 RepID=UPI00226F5FA8|nr:hypothetical protein [Streptomyces sp. H27-H5]MCY0958887.1 hypothetical protein [Streptomyces sp. H27-H5]
MSETGWYAQPFRADGGITARGLLSQLGSPSLSPLTLLVREAAQNSWDARLPDQGVVRFRLDLATVGAGHSAAWRRLFAGGSSGTTRSDTMFRPLSQAKSLRYLAISDRGTMGLAGPTRSDAGKTARREWARFVLNSGDRDGGSGSTGGGTFGYGKSALFRMSKVGCVFAHTRFRDDDGRVRSRFIGVAIRESFWDGETRYTGRHWWGLPEAEHCEPLTDAGADAAAHELGIPGFAGEETGTTLVVVDPDLTDPTLPDSDTTPELSVAEAGAYLADAAAWNLWPILLTDRDRRMSVTVTANGVDVPVPDEGSDAALAFFAGAYRQVADGTAQVLSCGKPLRELGHFAHAFTFGALVTSPAARELGIEGAPRHVCLMRGPELVVRYHPGPERSNPDAGYAAVFKVLGDLDETFARAEPPTHDAWEYQQLQGREATFVRTAGRRLKEQCDRLSGAQARKAVKVGTYAMGSVAQRLGHLLAGPGGTGSAVLLSGAHPGTARTGGNAAGPGGQSAGAHPAGPFVAPGSDGPGQDVGGATPGAGAGPGGGAAPGGGRSGVRRPSLIAGPRFEMIDGRPYVVQRVRVHGPDRVEGAVRVLTGDGVAEGTSPTGVTPPEVHGWRLPSDGSLVAGEVFYHAGDATEVDLIVTAVADVLVDISVVGRA